MMQRNGLESGIGALLGAMSTLQAMGSTILGVSFPYRAHIST